METSLTIDRKVSNKTKKTSELPASQKVEGSKLTVAEWLRQLDELPDDEWRRTVDEFTTVVWRRRVDKKPDAERQRKIKGVLEMFNTIDYDPDYDYKAERFRR